MGKHFVWGEVMLAKWFIDAIKQRHEQEFGKAFSTSGVERDKIQLDHSTSLASSRGCNYYSINCLYS